MSSLEVQTRALRDLARSISRGEPQHVVDLYVAAAELVTDMDLSQYRQLGGLAAPRQPSTGLISDEEASRILSGWVAAGHTGWAQTQDLYEFAVEHGLLADHDTTERGLVTALGMALSRFLAPDQTGLQVEFRVLRGSRRFRVAQ